MPRIHKNNVQALCNTYFFSVFAGSEIGERFFGILHGVNRLNKSLSRSFIFAVFPLGIAFLYMCAVRKHYLTKMICCRCRINRAVKAVLKKKRDISRMVDMCMSKQYKIDSAFINRNLLVYECIFALLHSAVNKPVFPVNFN